MKNIFILVFVGMLSLGGLLLFIQIDSNHVPDLVQEQSIGFKGLLSPDEFNKSIESGDFVVLDVRTLGEYQGQRITAGAALIDFYADDFRQKINDLDKTKNYLIYCRSGNRSGQTAELMEVLGFESFYELRGGINTWNQAGLSTYKG